jgi:hypothetical protein
MNWLNALKKLEIVEFSDFGQKTELFDIADGLRCYYLKTHPEFSPVWLRFPQSITLLQSMFPSAANARLNPRSFRELHGLKPTIRSLKPETHRQFRPPAWRH